jgi:hypothetical protein
MTEETPMKLHYFEGSTTCRPIVMLAEQAA